ncbi:MAG TPA: hypothetical protein VGU27_04365, partial [Candidatus Eisenbacteria bacterium]|nr:hypothetical protein [Candidatus Eisenbacteria bacterium]
PGGSAEKPARVAILVAHGMGQQVKFETLELVVNALRRAARAGGRTASDADVRQVPLGDDFLPRAEMTLTAGGSPREVHLYEAYWAPLTEGRISTPETFWFLVQAGWLGLSRAWRGGMKRLMFGDWQHFRVRRRTALAFLLATLTALALFVMNAVLLAAVASRGLGPASAHWPTGPLLADLTVDFLLVVGAVLALMLPGLALPLWLRRRRADHTLALPPAWLSAAGNALMGVLAVAIVLGGALVAYHLVRHAGAHSGPMWRHAGFDRLVGPLAKTPGTSAGLCTTALTLVLWGAIAGLGVRARHFLLQYVGDVAIYVSAYSVNRFYETRHAIHAAVGAVARGVYGLRDAAGAAAYDRIVVVGHSLGSVIAYDALDRVIREDPDPLGPGGAARRTGALVTFGSPLDKTAFIFRSQQSEDSQVREALAESVQPLIDAYEFRPPRWINLWSRFDWISGALDYYDLDASHRPAGGANPKYVENREDREASTPLQAHVEYWDGALLAETLWGEVMR